MVRLNLSYYLNRINKLNKTHNFLFAILFFFNVNSYLPKPSMDILENRAQINYPEGITFQLEASFSMSIQNAELVFGTDVIACGESQSRAIPEDFEPGNDVSVEWEWVLRKSGTLPPGTQVWWEWHLTDIVGNLITTQRETITFIDENDPWRLYNSESLEIYYLEGTENFALELANAGEAALDSLFEITGVEIEEVVSVYIYPNSEAMQTATLFSPDWSGGVAFSDFRTVLAGVPPNNLSWGREVVAHELTHVLIGVYTYSCVSGLPVWLNEGLAMYAEKSIGNIHQNEYQRLDAAILNDSLLSIREISNIFSNDPDLARQAYAQSLNVVEFLIDNHGQEKMLEMLDGFKGGYPQDQVLTQVYGYDQNSLYTAWRAWIGAPTLEGTPQPDATPTRTPFPTISPITGATIGETATQEVVAQVKEATPNATDETKITQLQESETSDTSFQKKLIFIGAMGIVIVYFLIRKQNPDGK